MNELIDLGILAAKVAAIGNEKAKMAVDGVSLAYNVVQIERFRHMISELYQIGNYVVFNASVRVIALYRNIIWCWNVNVKSTIVKIKSASMESCL